MSAFSVCDAPFGQLCRLVLGRRVFLYPDEKEGFQFHPPEETPVEAPTRQTNSSSTDTPADVEKAEPGYQTVGWYGETDPENPQTWSLAKKIVTFSPDLPSYLFRILWIRNHHSSSANFCEGIRCEHPLSLTDIQHEKLAAALQCIANAIQNVRRII